MILFLIGVIIMIFAVGASIALHEIGHMVPAKKFGVRVPQYMIGFGPTLWSKRGKETEYGIKAIPLGGYVRMIGMYPPRPTDPEGKVRSTTTGRFSQMIDEVREQSYEEVRPGDENRLFYKLKSWQKIIVMFSGPFMNLVIAAVTMLVMVSGIGLPQVHGTTVAAVQTCFADDSKTKCPADQLTPAAKSGIKNGDEIISIDGVKISERSAATRAFRAHPNQAIPVVVKRDGKQLTLTMTPAMRSVPKMDAEGNAVTNSAGDPVMTKAGQVGLSIGELRLQREAPTAVPGMLGDAMKHTAGLVLNIPQKMVAVTQAAFTDEKRDANGPISVVGVGRLAGDVTKAPGVELGEKALFLLSLIASLNIALFIFNLIPLLPLDGGHVAGAIWESIKRQFARARGIQGPVYADVTKGLPIAYGMSVLLIVMSVLLIYADLVKPIKLQ